MSHRPFSSRLIPKRLRHVSTAESEKIQLKDTKGIQTSMGCILCALSISSVLCNVAGTFLGLQLSPFDLLTDVTKDVSDVSKILDTEVTRKSSQTQGVLKGSSLDQSTDFVCKGESYEGKGIELS